ncbi:MAG: DUF1501 domain-containing protein [Pseudomonadota bacterium]
MQDTPPRTSTGPSRRRFLARAAALGCSAAASPLITPVTFAALPTDRRLVVIVLRGAMDGLDVLRPAGDPMLARHRTTLSGGEDAPALTDFHRMHPALVDLLPLWRAGELSFAQAVSTPYRDRRSHFDGQDLLENGGGAADGALTPGRDGWLNRVLALMPGATARSAFAVGRENLLLLSGTADTSQWAPDADLDLSPQARLLLSKVYAEDPLFARAAETAFELADLTDPGETMTANAARRARALAAFAAQQLRADARIAAFSITGWDTHIRQHQSLPRALGELQAAILTLKSELGAVWGDTAVLCLTEFGRTVRENGNRGTDHGTGGIAVFAGGALRGGAVHGAWPGLASGDLYQDRDLMPLADVRSYAAWAMRGLFGLERSDLEGQVFPGLDMGDDPRLIA